MECNPGMESDLTKHKLPNNYDYTIPYLLNKGGTIDYIITLQDVNQVIKKLYFI